MDIVNISFSTESNEDHCYARKKCLNPENSFENNKNENCSESVHSSNILNIDSVTFNLENKCKYGTF